MFEIAEAIIRDRNIRVAEMIELPARAERRAPLPPALLNGPLAQLIRAKVATDGSAWFHQSLALDQFFANRNVVVATGTASGKSLIFQLAALHAALAENTKTLVFYPLKALAADQHERWLRFAQEAGLPKSAVTRIDGDMATNLRSEALEAARVVLMTPDTCQAWMMRNVGSPVIRRFLDALGLLVLDEAHVYESVFGSNAAFLIRRLISAKKRVGRSGKPLRVIAATATIAYPEEHLSELTGLDFSVVSEEHNGAPAHPRRLYHLIGPETGSQAEATLIDLVAGILAIEDRANRRFIAFHDSRQGVERIVRGIAAPGVLPYRSGYEAADRLKIERALRNGDLDGVVSTSALELGIDISDMSLGINLGVPDSRKQFRQRIGRVGRGRPGAFFVIAGINAFRRFGETFRDYYEGSVEPSHLYLGNRFIQFANARCLVEEQEVLGASPSAKLGAEVEWPDGFDNTVKYAVPGAGRPREFDFIAQLGSDSPHFNYPLRQVGEVNLDLREGPSSRLGSIAMNQAIREAYPGATYLHMGRAYKVKEWRTRSFERSIQVFSAERGGAPTKPILRTTANLSLNGDSLVAGHMVRNATGLVAEVQLQVTESVEGYTIGGSSYLYRELRAEDPNMSRKQRDFRTTGILIQIDEPWFAGSGTPALARRALADGLRELLLRERSIAPQDVDSTSTNIALLTDAGPQRLTNAIIVYDAVYGGLRLTEDLFQDFRPYADQLVKAAAMAGPDAIVPNDIAERVVDWAATLKQAGADEVAAISVPDGWLQVYKPGSVVAIFANGVSIDRELGEPQLIDLGDQRLLAYSYQNPGGARGLVMHSAIQATGQDWQWALWNPTTMEFQDVEDA